MIYHYTFADLLVGIRTHGLRAEPMLLYGDFLATQEILLSPVVWFTTAQRMEQTVVMKARADGIEASTPDVFARIGCDESVAPEDLIRWADRHGHPPEMFRLMLLTGQMCGSMYTDWRICCRDVPPSDFVTVEVFDGQEWGAVGLQ